MKLFTKSTKSITGKFSCSSFSKLAALAVAILGITFTMAFAQDPHPGQAIFQAKCVMCHGQNGEGLGGVFPPVAESEWVNGPEENLVRIQLRGLSGPITVKGASFNNAMPPQADMSDQQIADVLSYVRSNMGNNSPAISADTVKAIRSKEAGNTAMLTVADLIDPSAVSAAVVESITEPTELEGFKPAISNGSSTVILLTIGIIAVCTLPVLFGLFKN